MKIRTKGLALLTTATMSLSMVAMPVFAADFSDMPNDWSKPALESAVSNGIFEGDDTGKIRPVDSLMRSEMATVINKAFNAKKTAVIGNYTDVKQGDWFYTEMSKAVAMKTFVGTGNKLNPRNNITREEVFVILARAFNIPKSNDNKLNEFTDNKNVSSWARDEVAALVSAGYVDGSYGYLNPQDEITRAEFAQMMSNLVKTYIRKGGLYSDNYNGNVMINESGVLLDGSSIIGDLIIGDGVGNGDTTLEKVNITGRLVVRGGDVDILGNSKIKDIIVSRVDGKSTIHANKEASIGQVIIESHDDVTLKGDFDEVVLRSSNITLNVEDANIKSIVTSGTGNKINVDKDSTIDEILAQGNELNINNNGSVNKVTAAEGVSGVTINGNIVKPGTSTDIEDESTKITFSNANRSAKVTLPESANINDYAVLVTGLDGDNQVTDKVARINKDKEVVFTFKDNSSYGLKLVKTNSPGVILDEIRFITNFPARDITTLEVLDSNIVTDLNNASEKIKVEYKSTVGDLLSAIETTDSGATVKVLSSADGYEIANRVEITDGMIVKVTAKDGTTTADYSVSAKTGSSSTLTVKDANVVSLNGEVLTVKPRTTVSELLAAIKLDDSRATVEVLDEDEEKVSGSSNLESSMIVKVTAQDGENDTSYNINVKTENLSNDTDLRALDLNHATVNNTSGSRAITIKDDNKIKTAGDLLSAIETKDSNADIQILGSVDGVEVADSQKIVKNETVVKVTAEDGTVVKYKIK